MSVWTEAGHTSSLLGRGAGVTSRSPVFGWGVVRRAAQPLRGPRREVRGDTLRGASPRVTRRLSSHRFRAAGRTPTRVWIRAASRGCLRVPNGDAASGFMLDHRCQPSGAERWVATTLRGRRDVPETEHLRVRRAGYGGFPRDLSRRPDGLRVIPGAAQVDLRDDLACDRS
jgi:hypothetical protein